MKRLLVSLAVLMSCTAVAAPTVGELSGAWYNPSTSGQGIIIEAASEGVSAYYFTFWNQPSGPQAWLVGDIIDPTSTSPVWRLYRAPTGQFASGIARGGQVGSLSIDPVDCDHAFADVAIFDNSMKCEEGVSFGPLPPQFCVKKFPIYRLTHATTCGR